MIRNILTSVFLSLAAGLAVSAQMPATELDGDIKLMVGCDLGRNGYYEQKPIAELMGKVADAVGPDAFLALGDTHHYIGIGSVTDPLWMTNYELIYSHPELQIEWCPVLGNHEYRGNTQAVIDYSGISRRWSMPARYYTRIFNNDGTRVKVVFIDTAPVIDKYREDSAEYPDASKQDMEAQLRWLDNELSRDDKADWTIVAGHHPIYAQTPKQSSERDDMQSRVDPILRKHKVYCQHFRLSLPPGRIRNRRHSVLRRRPRILNHHRHTRGPHTVNDRPQRQRDTSGCPIQITITSTLQDRR